MTLVDETEESWPELHWGDWRYHETGAVLPYPVGFEAPANGGSSSAPRCSICGTPLSRDSADRWARCQVCRPPFGDREERPRRSDA